MRERERDGERERKRWRERERNENQKEAAVEERWRLFANHEMGKQGPEDCKWGICIQVFFGGGFLP